MIYIYILLIIELLAIFLMNTALTYIMYSLYEYEVYDIKTILKDDEK